MAKGRLAQTRVGVLGKRRGWTALGRRVPESRPRRDDRLARPGQVRAARMAVQRRSGHRSWHIRKPPRTASCSSWQCWAMPPKGDRRRRCRQLQRQGRNRRDEPAQLLRRFPPKLSIVGEDSLGERVQRALPDAKVVKAFNTIGNPYFVDPSFSEGQPTMLIAGDDEGAKITVGAVLAASATTRAWPDAGTRDRPRRGHRQSRCWVNCARCRAGRHGRTPRAVAMTSWPGAS